jgi:hypothetical protein
MVSGKGGRVQQYMNGGVSGAKVFSLKEKPEGFRRADL